MFPRTHRTELDLLADALLNYETLDVDDVRAIMEGNPKEVHERLSTYKKTIRTQEEEDDAKASKRPNGNLGSPPVGDKNVLVQ